MEVVKSLRAYCPAVSFFDKIKEYVQFCGDDAERLAAFLPSAEPHFDRMIERFYDRIENDAEAIAIFSGPEQIARQKRTLRAWLVSCLEGPHDDAYYERRARIGRAHVEIGLPQHFMLTAMNVIRREFRNIIESELQAAEPVVRMKLGQSVDRILDLELAIMLETYQDDSQERVRRHERLAVIGQLAASIGHDLRNPLGVIESSVYILKRRVGRSDERSAAHLEKITKQVALCNGIMTDLLEMARRSPPRRALIRVHELLLDAREGVSKADDIEFLIDAQGDMFIDGERGLLRQCIVNLLTNAVLSIEGKGAIELVAQYDDVLGKELVHIEVRDNGPGFDAAVLRRIFEPLVTTRSKGTGLGLALVKSVVERHGGEVLATNREQGGALVRLSLPRKLGEASAAREE